MKLKNISIRNWLTIKKCELEFPQHGLISVSGMNLTAPGKLDSIGSGKTALGEAIFRPICRGGRFSNASDYSSYRNGDTFVRSVFAVSGEELVVESGFKCREFPTSKGEGLRYVWSGNTVERPQIEDTRTELGLLLGISQQMAPWTIFIDGDKLTFASLPGKQRADLFSSAFGFPDWDDYYSRVKLIWKERHDKQEFTTTSLQQQVGKLEQVKKSLDVELGAERDLKHKLDVATAEHGKTLGSLQESLQKLHGRKSELVERAKTRKKRLAELENSRATQYKELEVSRNRTETSISNLEVSLSESKETANTKKFEYQEAAREFKNISERLNGSCRSCGQSVKLTTEDRKILEDNLTQTNELALKIKADYNAAKAKIVDLENNLVSRRLELSRTIEKISRSASPEVEKISQESHDDESILEEVTEDTASINQKISKCIPPDTALYNQQVGKIAAIRTELELLDSGIAVDTRELENRSIHTSLAHYWMRAMAPDGIPTLQLNHAIGILNDVSRRISAEMTGGILNVEYATSKEMATRDEEKIGLVANVTNMFGAIKAEGNSKGERGLVNLIVAETLAEITRSWSHYGCAWYDEITPRQGNQERISIYSFLKSRSQTFQRQVFVVDHHSESATMADYRLLATKTADGTVFRWDS